MCLTYLKETKRKQGTGYKMFRVKGGMLYPLLQDGGPYPEGEWIKDTSEGFIFLDSGRYLKGFHIFTNKKGMRGWICDAARKVSFRDVVAYGSQDDTNVFVASEMYIHKGI